MLTSYNGNAITYDGSGNPLSMNGWTFTWQGGRQLAGMTNGTTTLSFGYNDSGLRTSKTVGNTTHTYTYQGSTLIADVTATDALYFHYDQNGSILGFTYDDGTTSAEYYYVKNLQGDILGILDSSGALVASYSYDAWGNILTATDSTLANRNPIRYRGYYYDVETALYYVSNRYYCPELCRFLNSDSENYIGYDGDFNSNNLFLYCGNNPVGRIDPNGTDWQTVAAVGLTVALVGVAILAAIPTGGGSLILANIGVSATAATAVANATIAVGVATYCGSAILAASENGGNTSQNPNSQGKSYSFGKNRHIDYEYNGNGTGNVHYQGPEGKHVIWRIAEGIEEFFELPQKVQKIVEGGKVAGKIQNFINTVRSLSGR